MRSARNGTPVRACNDAPKPALSIHDFGWRRALALRLKYHQMSRSPWRHRPSAPAAKSTRPVAKPPAEPAAVGNELLLQPRSGDRTRFLPLENISQNLATIFPEFTLYEIKAADNNSRLGFQPVFPSNLPRRTPLGLCCVEVGPFLCVERRAATSCPRQSRFRQRLNRRFQVFQRCTLAWGASGEASRSNLEWVVRRAVMH